MQLTDYSFNTTYSKKDVDVFDAFYSKCMSCCQHYDRITGYFGSTVYYIIWPALKDFIKNKGKIRLICSPILSDEDKRAMLDGYDLASKFDKSIENELLRMLSDEKIANPTKALSYLIANGILEIKIGVYIPNSNEDIERLVHDKAGLFYDNSGNIVGFRGSVNETYYGLSKYGNSESFDVFPNWEDQRDAKRCSDDYKSFNEIWNGRCPAIKLYDVAMAPFDKLSKNLSYSEWEHLVEEITVKLDEHFEPRWYAEKHGRPIREHQRLALDNWEKAGRRGLMEMATGSGKTFIGLCAIRDSIKRGEIPVVFVPSKLLFEGWKREIDQMFIDENVFSLLCGCNNTKWKKDNYINKFTSNYSSLKRYLLCEIDAVVRDDFFINNIDSNSKYLFIFDECHGVGSPMRSKILNFNSDYRLGLSATPMRYNDEKGNELLIKYFERIIEPRFTLYDAIKKHILTEYYYYPCHIILSEDDQDQWDAISKKISKYIGMELSKKRSIKEIMSDSYVQQRFIERSRIIKRAKGKVESAVDIIISKYQPGQKWIVYCDSQFQVGELIEKLKVHKEIPLTQYHTNINGDKKETLEYFKDIGGVLVSIKCLDEGVDIPSVTHALIIASSKNPREFIQRRGRILRNCERKNYAYLYDMIVTPNPFTFDTNDKSAAIVLSELARASEFGSHAKNRNDCLNKLKLIVKMFGLSNVDEYINGGIENDDEF